MNDIERLVLPSVVIVLAAGAACVYAYFGDARRAIYWAGVAVVNAAITF